MRYFKLTAYIVVIATLFGCSHSKYILKHKDEICASICTYPTDTIKTITKDTVVKFRSEYFIEPDLATIDLYLDCDSLNRVLISKVDSLNGKRTVVKYILTDNVLSLTALTDSIHGLIEVNRILKNVSTTHYVDREVPVEKIVYRSFWWHWLLHGIELALILVMGFLLVFKR